MTGFSLRSAAGWSLTWAIGTAIGVGLGAYVTVLGAAATPGDVALDVTELVVLPILAAVIVFIVSFVGRLVVALVRSGSRARVGHGGNADDDD